MKRNACLLEKTSTIHAQYAKKSVCLNGQTFFHEQRHFEPY
ncbi:hypothetical protein AB434_0372 [Heyndrickxia coagulans]|uniref:Uncharacterized protein n=1 Tax=Heyndrickxia coagulans TaxID=1398 RepID=A0AAN0T3Z8_HEYCO|nr:hypothetical protein SB48_HM08orf01255 [Heyndrickxia coagulans]AKN52777.1 hypothetical protein AB434_0372 [Heyndrickxia coagulans]